MTQTSLSGSTFFGIDLSVLADKFWNFRRRVSKRVLLLEFGSASLTMAQARHGVEEVEFTHVRRFELPPGAADRGVPTDPAMMAKYINQLCKEEKIFSRRVAVVIPAKASFSTIIYLPKGLTQEEARAYARDPESGLQIPIPLHQTDFDLAPCSSSTIELSGAAVEPYFLSSVPRKLIDCMLQTLRQADLELISIDLAFSSLLRLIAADIAALADEEFLLMLEFVRESTHLVLICKSGPVALYRLPAIREFPDSLADDLQDQAYPNDSVPLHQQIYADNNYMPISEMDLRVLINKIKDIQKEFAAQIPMIRWKGVIIAGAYSAHQALPMLLAELLGLRVQVVDPIIAMGVAKVSFSDLLLHQSLGRIIGLGLGLLPPQALVSNPLMALIDDDVKKSDKYDLDGKQEIVSHPAHATVSASVQSTGADKDNPANINLIGAWTAPSSLLTPSIGSTVKDEKYVQRKEEMERKEEGESDEWKGLRLESDLLNVVEESVEEKRSASGEEKEVGVKAREVEWDESLDTEESGEWSSIHNERSVERKEEMEGV